jgi:hypothetical protein
MYICLIHERMVGPFRVCAVATVADHEVDFDTDGHPYNIEYQPGDETKLLVSTSSTIALYDTRKTDR